MDPATGALKATKPAPKRWGTAEPVLFKVPEGENRGRIASDIREKVEGMYKGEHDQKEAKAEAEAELVKEAMVFANNVGVNA